jgi:glycosyltransferase involved in cell wall biosynthesis
MKKKINLLFTGPLPPPAGGISIHIWRLKNLLEDEFNIDFIDEASQHKKEFYNIRSFWPLPYLKKMMKADVVFIHSGSRILKKTHLLFGKLMGKKMIVTMHGYRKSKLYIRKLDASIYRQADKIILVNEELFNKMPLPAEKCVVKHAFLPPVMKFEPPLPETVKTWIETARNNNQVLICANASRLDLHNNEDLYGLDMCLEACKRMVANGFPVNFVYTVSALDAGADRFQKSLEFIKAEKLENHFLLIHERLSFVRLIENCDIVLRPTNTDGDALTVREAIYLGKKILASDIVARPEGTSLFKTRNVDDMVMQLETLVRPDSYQLKGNTIAGNQDYRKFYADLINNLFFESAVIALA